MQANALQHQKIKPSQGRLWLLSKSLNISVLLIGVIVLIAWQLDVAVLKRPLSGLVAMNPLTAICFILLSCSVFQLTTDQTIKRKWVVKGGGYIVLGVATLRIISFVWWVGLPIDLWVFHTKLEEDIIGNISNRMAPNTTIGFLFASIAVLFLQKQTDKSIYLAQCIILIAGVLGGISVLAYIYRIPEFYGVVEFIPMAIHTAIGFLLITLALLFVYPDRGFMVEFVKKSSGAIAAQRLIPSAILTPILLGFCQIYLVRNNYIPAELGTTIFVLGVVIIFLFFIWFSTRELNERDRLRNEVDLNLERSLDEASYYKYALDASAMLVFIDQNRNITYANNNFCKSSKYELGELIGQNYSMFESSYHSREFMEELWLTLAHSKIWKGELQNKAKGQTHYWSDITIVPFGVGNEHRLPLQYLVIGYDITERKDAEIKLEKAQAYLSSSIESYKDVLIFSLDTQLKYLFFNSSFKTATSVAYGTVVKEGMFLGDSITKDDDREKAIRNCERALAGERFTTLEEFGEINQRYYETKYAPILNQNKEVVGVTVLSVDVTQKKLGEERILSLNQELEAFSYTVSHDLRAPLRAINGYANIIREDYFDLFDEEGKRNLGSILYNSKKMGELIDDLLAYSRLSRLSDELSEINMTGLLNAVIEEVLMNNQASKVNFEIKELLPAKGEPALIKQVWVNLVSNAIKYSKNKSAPHVTVDSYLDQGMITYSVKDNGAGFDMKYYDKLFGVFQRLHSQEEFDGTGIGLAIVQKIIHRHKGEVWAESTLNEGSCFYFTLQAINS